MTALDAVRDLLSRRQLIVPVIDERLVQVAELLRLGLRDEAIGYAIEAPELVEAATLLDLSSQPQWQVWQATLLEMGIPEPVMPRMDLVAMLVKAQDDVVRLKPLLDRWRRMNLANAPLPDRIGHLRRLRKADPENVVWFEAQREHQKQRVMEIDREIGQATARADEGHLAQLVEELAAEWIELPPPRLVAAAAAALDKFRGGRIDHQLEEVGIALAAAHDGRDLDAARELRVRWQSLVDEKGALAVDDPRLGAALPAVEWVDNHDRMRSVSEEIWNQLDEQPPWKLRLHREWVRSLERLDSEVEELAEKLPDEVDLEAIERNRERVGRVRQAFDKREGFWRKLMYVGLGSAAAMLAATVWYFDDQSRFAADVDAAVQQVESMKAKIAAGEPLDLPDFENQWQGRVVVHPRVAGKLVELRSAREVQNQRRERLAAALTLADTGRAEAEKAGRPDPLAAWPAEFARATTALAEIGTGNLAVTDQEKLDFERMKQAIDRLMRRWVADADEAVRAKQQELDALTGQARRIVLTERAKASAILDGLKPALEALREKADAQAAPGAAAEYATLRVASPELVKDLAAGGALAKKIEELASLLADRERFEQALNELTGRLGDWEKYGEQLEAISREFKALPESFDYGSAAARKPQWRALDDWRNFAGGLGALDDASPVKAEAVTKAFAALSDEVKSLPMAVAFARDVLPALESFAQRDMTALQGAIDKQCQGPWLGEIKFVVESQTDDGNKQFHYALVDSNVGDEKFIAIVGAKRAGVDGTWPTAKVQAVVVKTSRSPQADLAGELARTQIPSAGIAMDEWFLEAIGKALGADAIDPLPRLVTVRKLLLEAARNSRSIRKAGDDAIQAVGAGDTVPNLPVTDLWLFIVPNPRSNAGYVVARPKAEAILTRVEGALPAIRQAVAAERTLLAKPIKQLPVLVGRLDRNAAGDMVAIWTGDAPGPGPVFWMKSGAAMVSAGMVGANGTFRPEGDTGPAGTPLYSLTELEGGKLLPSDGEVTPGSGETGASRR